MLLQNWNIVEPNPSIAGVSIRTVGKFVYLRSCRTAGGKIEDEAFWCTLKVRVPCTGQGHSWRTKNVQLSVKGGIFLGIVCAVLLHQLETWSLRLESVRRLTHFDYRWLLSIVGIERVNSSIKYLLSVNV